MAKTPTLIRSLARAHTPACINALAHIVMQPKSADMAKIAAASELLSRGWGKSTQPIAGDDEMDPVRMIVTGVPRAGD